MPAITQAASKFALRMQVATSTTTSSGTVRSRRGSGATTNATSLSHGSSTLRRSSTGTSTGAANATSSSSLIHILTRFVCKGCKQFSSDVLARVRAHFFTNRHCKKALAKELDMHVKDLKACFVQDKFYSRVEIRVTANDRVVGGQSRAPPTSSTSRTRFTQDDCSEVSETEMESVEEQGTSSEEFLNLRDLFLRLRTYFFA